MRYTRYEVGDTMKSAMNVFNTFLALDKPVYADLPRTK